MQIIVGKFEGGEGEGIDERSTAPRDSRSYMCQDSEVEVASLKGKDPET